METPKTSSDEIDLEELLLKIVLAFKRNIVLFSSFFLIGMALGFTYAMLGTKVYESKMMVTSDILTDSYSDKLNRNLNDIIDDENIDLLAAKLSLSMEEAAKIYAIEIEGVQKERPTIKEDEKQLYFLFITARTLDPETFPNLQKGLISFFENNEFAKVRVEQRKIFDREIIKKLEDEIRALETLKTKIYDGNFFEGIKGDAMFDPTEVNAKIIKFTEEKLEYQKDLALASSVQVVEGFTKFNRPVKPNRALSLAAGSTLGLVFVGFLIAFKSMRKLVRLSEENKQ